MKSAMTQVPTAQRPPRVHAAVWARGPARRVAPPLPRVDATSGFGGERGLAAP